MPAAGAVAAILVIIGSVMPWASVTTPFGTVSAAGTEGDGKLTLIAGLLLLGGAVASAWCGSGGCGSPSWSWRP